MVKNPVRFVLALCALTCFWALSLVAQDYKLLLGKWSMTSETDGDAVNWTLVLKDVDGKLIGSVASEEGETPLKELTYTDGVIKFKVPYQGEDYDIELKSTPDNKLSGTWSGGGGSGRTTGAKT